MTTNDILDKNVSKFVDILRSFIDISDLDLANPSVAYKATCDCINKIDNCVDIVEQSLKEGILVDIKYLETLASYKSSMREFKETFSIAIENNQREAINLIKTIRDL